MCPPSSGEEHPSTTFASRISARLPERLLVRLISLAYLRFEPEIRRLLHRRDIHGTSVDGAVADR
jgi:hypothetical protein